MKTLKKKKKGRRVTRSRSLSNTGVGVGGNVRERRQKEGGGEETDQCSAAWEASHPLLLTRPKHFEACFHREQLVCETTGVKLTLVAPHPHPLAPIFPSSGREQWMTVSAGSEPPQQWRQPAALMGAHPRKAKCSSLPEGPPTSHRPPAPAPLPSLPHPSAPGNRIQSTPSLSERLRAA